MKKLLTLLTCLNLILFSGGVVFSQENLDERVKEIETKIATASSKAATESSKAKSQRTISFIEGVVVVNSGGILTLSSESRTKFIYTIDSTKFINIDSSGKKLIGLGDIKVNDSVLVVGVAQVASSGTAKLVIRDQNKNSRTFSLIGKVSELKDTSLALSHFSRTDLPNINLVLTGETVVSGAKNKALDRTSLVAGAQVVASGNIDDKGTFVSKQIFLVKPISKTATSSAQ